jgi:hypothetical protein
MSASDLQPIRWRDALDLKVRSEYKLPVISNYQLAVELMLLLSSTEYAGRPIQRAPSTVNRRMFYEARNALMKRALLVEDKRLPNTLLRFPDRKDADPAEVLCTVDPFGYIAYLSAMAFHGLTDRLPKVLYVITPTPSIWSKRAAQKMEKDLGDLLQAFLAEKLPTLRHTKLVKLEGMIVETIRSKEPGGWRHFGDGALRVATIGNTFLQMLQRPDLCGGIRHVIDVFEEHARINLPIIVSEYSLKGSKIDRIRAGYILEEHCGIRDTKIDAWASEASRGGSRKLDAQADYSSSFSEKWCLSINV